MSEAKEVVEFTNKELAAIISLVNTFDPEEFEHQPDIRAVIERCRALVVRCNAANP